MKIALEPIHNNIVIKFKDTVKNGFFVDSATEGGLVVDLGYNHERSGKFCRLATVIAVGKDAEQVCSPGETVVVDHLMWTESFNFAGNKYWMTQPRCLVGKVS